MRCNWKADALALLMVSVIAASKQTYTTLLDRLKTVYHAASDVRPPLGLPSTSAFDALHRPVRNVSRNTSTECAIAVCVHSSPCNAACAEQVTIHRLDA